MLVPPLDGVIAGVHLDLEGGPFGNAVALVGAVRVTRHFIQKSNGGSDTERIVRAIEGEGEKTRKIMYRLDKQFEGLAGYLRGRADRD